jgi:c-di-GMP-binding flagellar brake protein YcgR
MGEDENGEVLQQKPSDRRSAPRLPVDGMASLLLLKHGSSVPCRVVDLSMGGCLLETERQFLAGILLRVEISFKVQGLAFRFNGVTQWTDGRRRVGVRFVDLPSRRKDELADLLCEVEQLNAAKAADEREPATSIDAIPPGPLDLETEPAGCATVAPGAAASPQSRAETSLPAGSAAIRKEPEVEKTQAAPPLAKPAKRERRAQSRHEVDTSAVIYLVNVGSRLQGRILDLSIGGCRIRTEERFPVGIYTRVETEFRLEGLPFRLGGVIQSIHDRQQVGLRFLDVSDRKRAQVEQLIEEIEEMRERLRFRGNRGPDEAAAGA